MGWWKGVRDRVEGVVGQALPMAGSVIGGIYGGGAGAAIGGKLGGALGSKIQSKGAQGTTFGFGSTAVPGSGGSSSDPRGVAAVPFNDPSIWQAGNAALLKTLQNPYGMNEAPLRGQLAGVETALQTARNKAAASTMGSGAGRGGVAQRTLGNVEMAGGAQKADVLRQWQEFLSNIGDERLRTLLLPYLSQWNQAYSTEMQPKPAEKGGAAKAGDLLALAKTGMDLYTQYKGL